MVPLGERLQGPHHQAPGEPELTSRGHGADRFQQQLAIDSSLQIAPYPIFHDMVKQSFRASPGADQDQVRGGRHTICLDTIDFDNRVWETDESDNTYCRQYIWSPYALADNTPVTRSSPPKKDSMGYTWYNSDGFSFLVQAVHPDAWWSAVGVLPSNASADYDVRLYDIGTYTGSEAGFGSHLQWSGYGGSVSDFVIVNDNMAAQGTYYAGAINYNAGTGDYRIEEDASEKIYPRPGTQWNGPYSKTDTNVLDIYEVYLNAGSYYFLLDQTAGTCDLGMTLYDDETVTATKSGYMSGGYANSAGDGGDEAFLITIPDAGFHGLVVWKVDASDYAKACTYRVAVGPPAISVTSPNGGETLYLGTTYNLTWDSFGPAATIGSSVKIEISRDGGSAWSTIIASTANDGAHPWTATGPLSNQCRIRVTSTTDGSFTDISNGNFTLADNVAPTPNPMSWSTAPYALSTTSIGMTASTASDPTGPISYFFDFASSPTGGAGGTDSAWIGATGYTDSGLGANHQYGYQVKARDGSLNETGYSSLVYKYTFIETPSGITFGAVTPTSIQARSANTPSNLTLGSSGLIVENVTNGSNSGWKQNNDLWTSSGLTPNTNYSFRAQARNGDADPTAWSALTSRYTLANLPSAGAFTNITAASIQANWGANGNPAGTQFYCENTTKGTNSGWITATSWNSTGLSSSTPYSFRVKAKNGNGVETGWVSLGSATTLPPGDVCECDLVKDGKCNILDYQLFIQDWGRTDCGTPPGSGGPPNDCECDLNKDGKCNILDYQIFIQDWGRTDCP